MDYKKQRTIDWSLILLYLLMVVLGWLSIYSSSYDPGNISHFFSFNSIAKKQLLFIFIAVIISSTILFMDVKILPKISYLIYGICMSSLILALFVGKEVGGAKAWFDFGLFGIQPAEFAKIGTTLAIAKFINNKKIYLNSWKKIIQVSLFFLTPILLILKQPDAGSALVYTSFLIMFYREGLSLKYVISVIIIGTVSITTIIFGIHNTIIYLVFTGLVFAYILFKNKKSLIPALLFFIFSALISMGVNYAYDEIIPKHQKERIDLIIGKEQNLLGSGYNLNQSLIAIGSGGILGKGFLKGTQTKFNFVPEQNTDFIFCTIGEEFGFAGSVFIIILFIALISRIIFLSEKHVSRFSRIFGYSVASIFFSHIFINISMTLGLMPIIGIPLPFFSYGGSSLLSFTILLFMFIKMDQKRSDRF